MFNTNGKRIINGKTVYFRNCQINDGVVVSVFDNAPNELTIEDCIFSEDCIIGSDMNNCVVNFGKVFIRGTQGKDFVINNIEIHGKINSILISGSILAIQNTGTLKISGKYGITCENSLIKIINSGSFEIESNSYAIALGKYTSMIIENSGSLKIVSEFNAIKLFEGGFLLIQNTEDLKLILEDKGIFIGGVVSIIKSIKNLFSLFSKNPYSMIMYKSDESTQNGRKFSKVGLKTEQKEHSVEFTLEFGKHSNKQTELEKEFINETKTTDVITKVIKDLRN